MRKNTLNFIVDLVALVVMLALAGTGLLLSFILVPGSRGGHGLSLWGWGRHDWGDLHFWLSISLLALIALHVILHWDWVCYTVRRWVSAGKSKMSGGVQWLYGLALIVVVVGLVGGFLGVAAVTVTRDAEEGEGTVHHGGHGGMHGIAADGSDHGSSEIRGSMTLGAAAAVAGVDVGTLKSELGLPASVSGAARLGRLRQEYGLEMSEIRAAVERLARAASTPDNMEP